MSFHIKSIDEFSRLINLKYSHNLIILNKQKKIAPVADVGESGAFLDRGNVGQWTFLLVNMNEFF
jgi:hypothetical protein